MPQCYGNGTTDLIPSFPGFMIRVGARGDYVSQIQTCLNNTINAGLNSDGIYGPLTQNAVINFQRANGLNPDGIVGPLTWDALMNECRGDDNGNVNASQITASPDFLISIGARGDYVRQIQNCLNDTSNAGLNSDGIFGPLTQVAVINYQRANGLNPDGIVGPITWEHLVSRCAGASITPASEIAAVVEPTQIIDYSAFNLEYVPNFVTTGSSETKLIQESVDVVETVFANKASKVNEENVLPQSSAAPQINMSNLLMYCLLRQMKK